MSKDGPTIRRHPETPQQFIVEYRGYVSGPYTLEDAQRICAELPEGVAAIERAAYGESPAYRKLKKKVTRTRLAARNPANLDRRRRIAADLAGFNRPYPPLKTQPTACDDWMAPFTTGPIVLPTPEKVRRWQTAARAAAIDYRKTLLNRSRQPKAAAKGTAARRRQGRQTAAQVLALARDLHAAGMSSRKVAARIAAMLNITPRQARNILNTVKGKFPQPV